MDKLEQRLLICSLNAFFKVDKIWQINLEKLHILDMIIDKIISCKFNAAKNGRFFFLSLCSLNIAQCLNNIYFDHIFVNIKVSTHSHQFSPSPGLGVCQTCPWVPVIVFLIWVKSSRFWSLVLSRSSSAAKSLLLSGSLVVVGTVKSL